MGLFSSKPEQPKERSAVAQALGDRPVPNTKEELHDLLKGTSEERAKCCPEICNKCKKCEGFGFTNSYTTWVFIAVLLIIVLMYYRMQ